MKKIIEENIDYAEEITLCKDCLVEVELEKNDWDSFCVCPSCEKDNFTGNLKMIDAIRQQITRIIRQPRK